MANQFQLAEAYTELTLRDKGFRARLARVQRNLKAFQARLDMVAVHARRFLLVAGGIIALTVKIAASFEQSMARVKALTGATGEEFEKLRKKARELGETTEFSASQAAQAMSAFALAGFSVNKILAAMPDTLNLAAAGQLDVGTAADIVAKLMAGMGIEADKLGESVDVLATAFTTSNTDLVQLGEAMKFVGPVAKSAGIKLTSVTAAIQMLSNAGIQGTMAGTSLRGIYSRLSKTGSEAEKVFKSLGVAVREQSGKLRPLADLIGDFNTAVRTQGREAEITGLAMVAFGDRAGPAFAAMLSQGQDELVRFEKRLEDVGGTAERIAKIQMDTLLGRLKKLWSAVESVAIEIGSRFQPEIEGIVKWLTDLAKTIANLTDKQKKNIVAWISWGVKISLALVVLPKLIGLIRALVAVYGGLKIAALAAAGALGKANLQMGVGAAIGGGKGLTAGIGRGAAAGGGAAALGAGTAAKTAAPLAGGAAAGIGKGLLAATAKVAVPAAIVAGAVIALVAPLANAKLRRENRKIAKENYDTAIKNAIRLKDFRKREEARRLRNQEVRAENERRATARAAEKAKELDVVPTMGSGRGDMAHLDEEMRPRFRELISRFEVGQRMSMRDVQGWMQQQASRQDRERDKIQEKQLGHQANIDENIKKIADRGEGVWA